VLAVARAGNYYRAAASREIRKLLGISESMKKKAGFREREDNHKEA